MKINIKVPHDVNDAVHFIKKAGKIMILTKQRSQEVDSQRFAPSGHPSRNNSIRSFNTNYGASRPHSQSSSVDEDEMEMRK